MSQALPPAEARATVRAVPWLASLGEEALDEVIASGHFVCVSSGRALMRELEVGDSLCLILQGHARVTVAVGLSQPLEVGTLRTGDTCGELALLTRELRSATVTAVTDVQLLRLDRSELETLLERYPRIAVHFAREIAARLADSDRALDALLESAEGPRTADARRLSGQTAAVVPSHGSLWRAWRELVVTRRQELPFLALAAFLGTLVSTRAAVWLAQRLGADLFVVLRSAYTSGIAILVVAVATSFLHFAPATRRAIATGYGVGFALIFNELSVFLAFDTFYLDMTTRDSAMVFDVAKLYGRSESTWALALALAVLLQATYLRRFYRRILFILANRFRALFSRRE